MDRTGSYLLCPGLNMVNSIKLNSSFYMFLCRFYFQKLIGNMSETARTEKNSSKNIYGDPPKISISLPGISELTQNSKCWRDVQLPIGIVLLTVKDCEFLSCYHYVVDPFRSYFKGLGHVHSVAKTSTPWKHKLWTMRPNGFMGISVLNLFA